MKKIWAVPVILALFFAFGENALAQQSGKKGRYRRLVPLPANQAPVVKAPAQVPSITPPKTSPPNPTKGSRWPAWLTRTRFTVAVSGVVVLGVLLLIAKKMSGLRSDQPVTSPRRARKFFWWRLWRRKPKHPPLLVLARYVAMRLSFIYGPDLFGLVSIDQQRSEVVFRPERKLPAVANLLRRVTDDLLSLPVEVELNQNYAGDEHALVARLLFPSLDKQPLPRHFTADLLQSWLLGHLFVGQLHRSLESAFFQDHYEVGVDVRPKRPGVEVRVIRKDISVLQVSVKEIPEVLTACELMGLVEVHAEVSGEVTTVRLQWKEGTQWETLGNSNRKVSAFCS